MIKDLLSDNQEHTVQEMKAMIKERCEDEVPEGKFAGSINTLIRQGAIEKTSRGVYINGRNGAMRSCFVVSAIGADDSEERKYADKVLKYIIQPVCEATGFEPERSDRIDKSDVITQTIVDKLVNADLVIADITRHNPNAFYEIGYRDAVGKPLIYIRDKKESIPFDISGTRVFEYDLSDLDSVDIIKERLIKTIEAMNFDVEDDNSVSNRDRGDDYASLISVLYEVKDEISDLKKAVSNQNVETIQSIVKSLVPTVPQEDPNTALMKAVLPELLKNPESFKTLIEISNMKDKGRN